VNVLNANGQNARCADRWPEMSITHNQALSEACYSQGKYRYAEDGTTILNELGTPAKHGQIILRATNGYPLARAGDKGPVDIDLRTGKPIKVA
jgi:hypothetical protein